MQKRKRWAKKNETKMYIYLHVIDSPNCAHKNIGGRQASASKHDFVVYHNFGDDDDDRANRCVTTKAGVAFGNKSIRIRTTVFCVDTHPDV